MGDPVPDPVPGSDDDRRLDQLVQTVSEQAVALARQEVRLAQQEMAEKARHAAPGAAMVGAAGLLGALATGTGTAGLVLVLGRRPRPWGAALAVTGLYAGAGAVLARAGVERMREAGPPIPERTVGTLREDLRWMKGLLRRRRGS